MKRNEAVDPHAGPGQNQNRKGETSPMPYADKFIAKIPEQEFALSAEFFDFAHIDLGIVRTKIRRIALSGAVEAKAKESDLIIDNRLASRQAVTNASPFKDRIRWGLPSCHQSRRPT
jgi:hypothetical protein